MERNIVPTFKERNLLGIPVTLLNTVTIENDGVDQYISIPSQHELIAAVAVARSLHPAALHGSDVVALRKACGMSGVAFSEALGMAPETLSRIERGAQSMGAYLEKLVRILVAEKCASDAIGISYPGARSIVEMDIEKVDQRT